MARRPASTKPKRTPAAKPMPDHDALDLLLSALDETQLEQLFATLRNRWQALHPSPTLTLQSLTSRLETLHAEVKDFHLASLAASGHLVSKTAVSEFPETAFIMFRDNPTIQVEEDVWIVFAYSASQEELENMRCYSSNATRCPKDGYEPTGFSKQLPSKDARTGDEEPCVIYARVRR